MNPPPDENFNLPFSYDFDDLEKFLTYYKSSSPSEQKNLLNFYSQNKNDFSQWFNPNQQISHNLSDLKILLSLNFPLYWVLLDNEAFEYLLEIDFFQEKYYFSETVEIKEDDKSLYEKEIDFLYQDFAKNFKQNKNILCRFPKHITDVIKTLEHLKSSILFQQINLSEKHLNKSLYFFLSKEKIYDKKEVKKIVLFLFDNALDIYDNFADLCQSNNLKYLYPYLEIGKLNEQMISIYLDCLAFNNLPLCKKILQYHQYFSLEDFDKIFYLYEYSLDPYFKNYLLEKMGEIDKISIKNYSDLLIKEKIFYKLLNLWTIYKEIDFDFIENLIEDNFAMCLNFYHEANILDLYKLLNLSKEKLIEHYPEELYDLDKMILNKEIFEQNEKQIIKMLNMVLKKKS